jgi:hypothetical protein
VAEFMAMTKIALSAGLTLRMLGGAGRLVGNWPAAAWTAACTSWAAPSRLRLSSNCRVTLDPPSWLDEIICVRPGMLDSWRSSGAATLEAMVSGLAPGRPAPTWMVGKSTCGRAETGSWK